jgi:CheY-like chemotaxis protein
VLNTVGELILAVEDSPIALEVCMHVLGDAGHEVSLAKDGSEALKVLEAQAPDLVVLVRTARLGRCP